MTTDNAAFPVPVSQKANKWDAWKKAVVDAGIERPTPNDWRKDAAELFLRAKAGESPATRAFLRGAHAMNGAAVIELAAAKADAIALLTLLQDTTQSRSVAERCAKAKAVLG